MNCATDQPHQPWEASEGMVQLFTELALLNAKSSTEESQARANSLAALLPSLASAFSCSHYRHHYMLKQRVCERLPSLTEALGPQRLVPHFPELLRITVECAGQTPHH